MPYIYKIVNDINNKQYIGKTTKTPHKRFIEHCATSRNLSKNRPQYKAMRKHGQSHFKIEVIEECDESMLEEREKYWIEHYGSYKHGYNATLGGDGKSYLDYDLIVRTYHQVQSQREVANLLGIDTKSVKNVLCMKKCNVLPSTTVNANKNGKPQRMMSLNGKTIKVFSTTSEAARYLLDNSLSACRFGGLVSHLGDACKGKRQTVAGYKWEYI